MKADLYIEAGLPSDEELERITDYVGHYMTPAERDAFEAQMRDDAAFFYRVAPVLDAPFAVGRRDDGQPTGPQPGLVLVTPAGGGAILECVIEVEDRLPLAPAFEVRQLHADDTRQG